MSHFSWSAPRRASQFQPPNWRGLGRCRAGICSILRRLAKNGILHVTRGVAGGYELARPPRQITLLNLVEAVEKSNSSKRSVARGLGMDSRTRLTKALQNVSRSANEELRNVSVADLMQQKRRRNGR